MTQCHDLQPGDYALTDYNGPGPMVRVQIVARDDQKMHGLSQSGIMYRVQPKLKNGTDATWYDADWFFPDIPHGEIEL